MYFVPLECVYSTAIVPLPLPNVVFAGKHVAAADCNEAFWQDGSKAFSDAIADYIACGFSCANAEGDVSGRRDGNYD